MVIWHVNNLEIFLMDPKVVSGIINKLDKVYGQEIVNGKRNELTICQGKFHNYLGMKMDYSKKGAIIIGMRDYLKKIFEDIPKHMDGSVITPTSNNFFIQRNGAEKLPTKDAEFFHTTTAKLFFLCKRGQPDIQTAAAFLCTCVQSPTINDMLKLGRTIKYIWSTKDLVLLPQTDSLKSIKWWIGVSFVVHKDMWSHTGGMLFLRVGATYAILQKKLNTTSLTKAKLVRSHDVLPNIIWTRLFMEDQGYVTKAEVLWDNTSTIKLKQNFKWSFNISTSLMLSPRR